MNERLMVDELTYRSYAHNRRISPEIAPERWGVIFSNWRELEQRFQWEQHDDKNID